MRAKRFSNDRTGTTKARRSTIRHLEGLGRSWAELFYRGKYGDPTRVGNSVHDAACAEEWERLTGKPPNWK